MEPRVSNSALQSFYSYAVSDGAVYFVTANLTLTMSSQFAVNQDALGNPYQTVVDVKGVRAYTNLSSGETTIMNVTGITHGIHMYNYSFYPYSLLGSSPGVYTMNTAPFWDLNGLLYASSSSTAVQLIVKIVQQGSVVKALLSEVVYFSSESLYHPAPLLSLQQQTYTLL